MTTGNARFPKEERLSNKKLFERLFAGGKSFYIHPFRIIWIADNEAPAGVSVAFAVPKKIFKRAVDRNKVRRRIKEAYRLNKDGLRVSVKGINRKVSFIFIYQDSTILEYEIISKAVVEVIDRLILEVHKQKG